MRITLFVFFLEFGKQLNHSFDVKKQANLKSQGTKFELVDIFDLRHILTSIDENLEAAEFDKQIREIELGRDGRIKYEDFIARIIAK